MKKLNVHRPANAHGLAVSLTILDQISGLTVAIENLTVAIENLTVFQLFCQSKIATT